MLQKLLLLLEWKIPLNPQIEETRCSHSLNSYCGVHLHSLMNNKWTSTVEMVYLLDHQDIRTSNYQWKIHIEWVRSFRTNLGRGGFPDLQPDDSTRMARTSPTWKIKYNSNSITTDEPTDHADDDANQLEDIGERHWIHAAKKCIDKDDNSAWNDSYGAVDLQHNRQSSTWKIHSCH